MFSTIVFFTAALIFSVLALHALFCLRWAHRLPPLAQPLAHRPRVSIVFAARDEEERAEQTIRHLLVQEQIDFEIIPVDDRSKDRTGEIFTRLAREDARVKPQRVEVLPEGWLGKCHACHLGAQHASAHADDWLLFTDADCWLKPDVIARAIRVAQAEEVDHITLTPGVAPETIPAEGWHLAFLMAVASWIAGVNRDKPGAHLGVGAFNLVRAKTYRAFGGHETLRLTVVDDVKLGLLVRRAGGRTRAFIGGDDVECHWGVTVRQMVRIMEKNFFAAADYRMSAALGGGPLALALWGASMIGPFTGTFLGWAACLSLLLSALPAMVIARRLRWPARGALFTPFAFAAVYYAVLNSTFATLRQGGIRWRDTFYSLEVLRKGNMR